MPSEIRRLVFYHSEVTEALTNYGKDHGMDFPKGKVISAKLMNETEHDFHTQKFKKLEPTEGFDLSDEYNIRKMSVSILVVFFDEETFDHKYFSLSSEFISSALIRYCINNAIPIPRRGKKKLDLTEFNVCLDIVIDSDNLESLSLTLE